MSSNASLEFLAIKKVLEDKNPQLLVAVSPEYFGNQELRKLFLLIRRYYIDQNEFISFDTLKALVAKACSTAEKLKFMVALLDQINNKDVSGLTEEVLLKELQDFHKFRLILTKAGDLVNAVEAKDIDTTLGVLQKLYASVYVESNHSLDEYEMSSLANKDIKFEFRKTGIREWDQRGGLIKGGLTLVAAEAKAGKSTLCGQIALHQYLHEEGSICVLSYEMSSQEYRSRILANYCSVDLGRVMSNTLTPDEQRQLRVKESQFYISESEEVATFALEHLDMDREKYFEKLFATFERRANKFYVIDERLDWMSLFAKMQLLAETKGVVTFVIDYINLVPMSADTKNLAQWEAILQQSRKLKNFSHKYGLNVITPAQLSVGKKGEESKIRFASNIIADCDVCLAMHTTEEDKMLDTVTCEFKAIRNGLSVEGKAFNAPFKLVKEFNMSRFTNEVDF